MTKQGSRVLHIVLWVLQGLLGALFIFVGFTKISMPINDLAEAGMTFVNSFSEGMVRFIGVSELLGGLGLILPALLRIRPILTPLAAAGLAIVMVLAAGFHISKGEDMVQNIVLFVLFAFIAYGRFRLAPIQPK